MNRVITKKTNSAGRFTINMCFLIFYIITSYIAQDGLLPTVLNSLALYGFLGVSFLNLCYNLKEIFLPNFTIWYGAVFVLSALSFLYSRHVTTSALYAMFVALVLSFCFITTVTDFDKIDMLARTYIWSSVIMSIILYFTDQLILDVEEGERLGQELSGNANAFAAMVMSSAIFAAWLMVYRCKWKTRWIYILAFVSQLFVMALSGGRKYLFATIICAMVFIFFYSDKKHTPVTRNLFICLMLLFAAYFAIMNIPMLYESIGKRFESLYNDIFGLNDSTNTVSGMDIRSKMIQIGLEGWLEAPLFGHGLDSFKYFNVTQTGHFYYAHNNYVELLYDLGLTGFIAYYGFVVYMLVKLIKMPRDLLKYKILGVGLLVELLIYDFGGVAFYATFSICILAVVYIIIKTAYEQINSNKVGSEAISNG